MTGRVATNARERWALLITSEAGQDLTTRDRCIGLRVCLAATDDGTAEGFDLDRLAFVEGLTVAEVRAALRRLWRQHWISGDLDDHAAAYDLTLGIPWWTLDSSDIDNELQELLINETEGAFA